MVAKEPGDGLAADALLRDLHEVGQSDLFFTEKTVLYILYHAVAQRQTNEAVGITYFSLMQP